MLAKIRLNNNKAASVVLGVILMVAITVAIAGTVYIYTSGMINASPQTIPSINFIQEETRDQLLIFSSSPNHLNWKDFMISWENNSVNVSLNPGNIPLNNNNNMPDLEVIAGYSISFDGPTDISIRHIPTNSLTGTWSFSKTHSHHSGDTEEDPTPEYTLSVSVSGDGSVSKNPNKPTYSDGDHVILTASADSGWSFDGWSGDVSGSTNPLEITMNGNMDVNATFNEDPTPEYTLSVSVSGDGSVSKNPDKPTYDPGDTVELTASADSGWSFDGWSGDVSGSTNPLEITMNGNMDVIATFIEDQPGLLVDDFEGDLSNWNTDWELVTSQYTSPTHSIECDDHDNDLISKDLNTYGGSSITISFRYRIDDIDPDDNVMVQYWNGHHYNDIEEIGDDSEDTWHTYSHTIYNYWWDAQYFITHFRIKIEGSSLDNNEHLWIDDVSITMN